MNIQCISHKTRFDKIVDVCNYFGHSYTGYQRGGASIIGHPNMMLWFPKINSDGPWANTLSFDETTLIEAPKEKSEAKKHFDDIYYKNIKMSQHCRVVFARQNAKAQEYVFLGVYELDLDQSDYDCGLVWVRVKKEININVAL